MDKSTLIIGSSGVMGKRLIPFVSLDYKNIILCGRNLDTLKEQKEKLLKNIKGINIYILCLDICVTNAANIIEEFLAFHKLKLESIINTSYYSSNGEFSKINFYGHNKTIHTNISAFISIIYWYLMYSKKNNVNPKILSFSSMCSLHGIPNTAIYSGSKAFLINFFQALSIENPNMFITVSCPGPFSEKEKAKNMFKSVLNIVLPNPEKIAKKSYYAFKKGKLIVYPDLISKLYKFKAFQWLFLIILKKFYKYN